jgi:hypothetical protein
LIFYTLGGGRETGTEGQQEREEGEEGGGQGSSRPKVSGTLSPSDWPLFQNPTLKSMQWNLTPKISEAYKKPHCDFFDSIGYDW